MEEKKFWESKTFWVNLIASIALIVQAITNKEIISMEIQATILAIINIILRFITKGKVTF